MGEDAEGALEPADLANLPLHQQRRQLTVLFSDIVGSTGLSAELDPEELDEVISAFQRHTALCVEAAGGFVARFMGDAVLAYFGYPQVREDDARRAVRVGLEISRRVPALPTPFGQPLAVRIGIATGVVVLGETVRAGSVSEQPIAGATPNLAARIQQAAPPNGVWISGLTARLVQDDFELTPVNATLRDFPVEEVWQVLSEQTFDPAPKVGRAPIAFVGREAEMALLLETWTRARSTRGQAVTIVGPPGIGKSRIVQELRARLADERVLWLQGGSASSLQNTPLQPIAQIVRRLLGASDEKGFRRLKRLLARCGVEDRLAATLIAELVGTPIPPGEPRPVRAAADQRSRLIGVLAKWLRKCAARWPTVLVVEDLHWADPTTLEFLDVVAQSGLPRGLMLLGISREEPPTGATGALRLDGLGAEHARRLVQSVGGDLPRTSVAKLAARSGGIPLFAIELARYIGEARSGEAEREIPSALSDLLLARLDRLGGAKLVAQVASVLGGEFQLGMLSRLTGAPSARLTRDLEVLIDGSVIARVSEGEDPTFAFTHALIEDAAYSALLKRHRRELHRRAAALLLETYPDFSAAHPEIVARHWSSGEEHLEALAAWRRAARLAWVRRAHLEAQAAYESALAALRTFPPEHPVRGEELELQSALADVLQITHGYSAPATVAAADLAKALAERGGDVQARFTHAAGLWMACSSAGDYEKARALAEQLLALSRADGRPVALAGARMMAMTSRYRVADLGGAEEAFLQGQEYFAEPAFLERPGAAPQTYGNAAVIAWLQGDRAEAERRSALSLRLSADTQSPYEIAFAKFMAGSLAMMQGDAAAAADLAGAAMALSDEHGFPQYSATTRIVAGRARAGLGDPRGGADEIADGLERMRANGSAAWLTVYLSWLAEAQALGGNPEAARRTIEEALLANRQETFFRPHLLKVRGDARRALGDKDGAEADYLHAVHLSRLSAAVELERGAAEALAGG